MFDLVTCPCCKKEYIKNNSSIYKITYRSKLYRVCSYSCYHRLKELKDAQDYAELEQILFTESKN